MPGKKKAGRGPRAPAAQLTAQQLQEQALIALQYDDYDAAKQAYRQAAKLEPNNLEILEALGALLAEIGEGEEAVQVLKQAVQLSPDVGHEKYMYLGQLSEGEAGISYTRKGVKLLQELVHERAAVVQADADAAMASTADADEDMAEEDEEADQRLMELEELRQQLCAALCSLAELQLAGAGDVEAVSEEVEALLRRAQASSSSSPEPGQVLASLRYEQGRPEEALQELRGSMALWFWRRGKQGEVAAANGPDPGKSEMAGEGADSKAGASENVEDADAVVDRSDMDESDSEDDEEDEPPSYEFRFECAKLLIELDESTEDAIRVLEDLVEEDDSNPDVWHLLGLAYYGGHMYDEAQEIVNKGQELLKKLNVPEDHEIRADFEDLQSAINEALKQA